MKLTILNGSPKGEVSNTMQYYSLIKRHLANHSYTLFNIGRDIDRIENEPSRFEQIVESMELSDGVIWVYPVFYFLVPSPLKRFIELLFEKGAKSRTRDTYATAITTSMHLFDHTSHNYIHAISEDLGMHFVKGFSAQFNDLVRSRERRNLLLFAEDYLNTIQNRLPVEREFPEVIQNNSAFVPGKVKLPTANKNGKLLLLTDQTDEDFNLKGMTDTLLQAYPGESEVVNIRQISLKGGCLSCLRCTYDGICAYDDDMNDIYRNKILQADAIVYAGSIKDRYLSSRWKMFFDRFFVNAHRPVLRGKQGGFIISGPLRQNPNLRQLFTCFAESFGLNLAGFVTDEYGESGTITSLLENLAARIVWGVDSGYRRPVSFLGVGGHKIMRDLTYLARFVFLENYTYYQKHDLFDFPHKMRMMRFMGHIIPPLMAIPAFRKRYQRNLNQTMVAPLVKAVHKE